MTNSAAIYGFYSSSLEYNQINWIMLGRRLGSNEATWMNFIFQESGSAGGLGIWGANSAITWNGACHVGIGNQSPGSEVLTVGGNVIALKYYAPGMYGGAGAGNYTVKFATASNELVYDTSTSSLRYKKDISQFIDDGILYKLNPVTFRYIENPDILRIGLIAEDVAPLDTEHRYVAYDKDGRPDSINYEAFITPLIAAVKSLKAEVETLKSKFGV
jgi:hypothetical protein